MNSVESNIAMMANSIKPSIGIVNDSKNQVLEINGQKISITDLSVEQKSKITDLVNSIDLKDSSSIVSFGSGAQKGLTDISEKMMTGVKSGNAGEAGKILNGLVTEVRTLNIPGLKNEKVSGMTKWIKTNIFKRLSPVQHFIQKYETVSGQINTIVTKMTENRNQLIRDVASLDQLYETSKTLMNDLKLYIIAGKTRIGQLNDVEIPALKKIADETNDLEDAQKVTDLVAMRDDLDRRITDMMLTRATLLQFMPGIRQTQEVDKALIGQLQSGILNTVPLWKAQISLAITQANQSEALAATTSLTNANNDIIIKNAQMLKKNSVETRKQIERGIVDVETLKTSTETLLSGIQESLKIVEDGRARRRVVEQEIGQLEDRMKKGLLEVAISQSKSI